MNPERLRSLDVFRGLTMLLMLLVNNIALDVDTPAQLLHADFGQGVHAADLVFPWFLFIVGVALPLAASSWYRRGGTVWGWRRKAARRCVNLFLLGCLIDISLYKQFNIYMDVLQLIALAYWAASFFHDLPAARRMGLAAFLLAWHWALCRFVPPPGAPVGWFHGDWNILAWIDQTWLVRCRLWGLVGVVPTTALVLLGSLAGDVLRSGLSAELRYRRLALMALVCIGSGLLVNLSIPFSKTWWTSSYILYTGGWGVAVLAVLHWLVDARGVSCFPLQVFGMNAMAVYVAPIVVKLHTLQEWYVGKTLLGDRLMGVFFHHFGRYAGGWIYTWCYVGVCWLIAWGMYRKKWFWRV
ncbi:MAG TPA: heparan-alpha-glucosaminide N-acetyltransferase domain-containing protein [Candidatus Xenobia bacterium]